MKHHARWTWRGARGIALALVVLAGCREPNPEWLGPASSALEDGTSTDAASTDEDEGANETDATSARDASYSPCGTSSDCPEGLVCNEYVGYCSIDCSNDGPCPAPPTGDALPLCSPLTMTCILPCHGNFDCPDDMSCETIVAQRLCAAPTSRT